MFHLLEEFLLIGKVVAMSIVQGGSGFPVFLPGLYHYLTTGEYLGVMSDSQVPDAQVRELLLQVGNTILC
jgi:hypothetical protein